MALGRRKKPQKTGPCPPPAPSPLTEECQDPSAEMQATRFCAQTLPQAGLVSVEVINLLFGPALTAAWCRSCWQVEDG